MNTQISSKFAALVLAVMMNSLIIGAMTLLFSAPIGQHVTAVSFDRAPAQLAHEAA